MKTQKEIKRKIKAVVNIQKVTKAMETMASIKLQKASRLALSARQYSGELSSFVSQIVNSVSSEQLGNMPFCRKSNDKKNILFAVISPEKGLCGPLSGKIMNRLVSMIEKEKSRGINTKIIAVGRKGVDFLKKKKFDVISSYPSISNVSAEEVSRNIVNDCIRSFSSFQVDEVYLCYSHFSSTVRSDIITARILPVGLDAETIQDNLPAKQPPVFASKYPDSAYSLPPFYFDNSVESVTEKVFTEYVRTMVTRSLLESIASENAARMIAMQQATINADEMIADLNLLYNKARQAIITRDIVEIISSANALN